jgi:hypothetical protein
MSRVMSRVGLEAQNLINDDYTLLTSQIAQNNAQDDSPLTGNIMKISPWYEFSHEGGVLVCIHPMRIRCI